MLSALQSDKQYDDYFLLIKFTCLPVCCYTTLSVLQSYKTIFILFYLFIYLILYAAQLMIQCPWLA